MCSETVPVPNIKLNNGLEMPQLGLGTWKAEKGKIAEVTNIALHLGYRCNPESGCLRGLDSGTSYFCARFLGLLCEQPQNSCAKGCVNSGRLDLLHFAWRSDQEVGTGEVERR